ncbi:MAG: hypothetical protein QGH60_08540 [Phycisphaerae bacterium]|jgi:hypothetical protein|nr:hypothetical protein [Phycisphaerae bacterium]
MKPLTVVIMMLLLSVSVLAVDPPDAATSMPVGAMPPMVATGSIAIKVVQGTKGGPKIGSDEVTVELYGYGGKLRTIETKLDVHGVVTIEHLPLVAPFRPRVFVKHGGASYTEDGEEMNADNPTQDITVKVFETSDKNPQWKVTMWHVILRPAENGGMRITESLAVNNTADSAWLGSPDTGGRRTSIALSLLKGAKDLTMSGALHDCCASVVDGRLLSKAPLTPGTSRLELGYTAPRTGEKTEVNLVAPAATKQLMIFVPRGSEGFKSDSLKSGDVVDIDGRPMQTYTISDVSAGRKISFAIGAMPVDAMATSRPAAPKDGTGLIAIRAVQGTKGGPKIGPDKVTVELYGRGGKLRTIETKLDTGGVAMIKGLPLSMTFQPKVTVQHAGSSYSEIGEIMDAGHPTQEIAVKVFETSDKDPQLQVAMWHLIVQPAEKGGMDVVEMLVVRNMADSAYLGTPDAEGRRISVALSLPKGVLKVDKMEGALHDCCASVVGGRLISKAPLAPGMSQLKFHYIVPTPDGKAEVKLVAPAAAKQLMVFVPQGVKGLDSDTLKIGMLRDVRDRPMQAYTVSDISAGQEISFTLPGMPKAVAKASPFPKILAALGGVILIILCIVVLLTRRPETEGQADAA